MSNIRNKLRLFTISILVFLTPMLSAFSKGTELESTLNSSSPAEVITPLLLSVLSTPVPFTGSDGRVHLVYEVLMTNFSSSNCVINQVDILANGTIVATLDAAAVASRLQPAGSRDSSGTIGAGTNALLFIHLTLPAGAPILQQLNHVVKANFPKAPSSSQNLVLTGASTQVSQQKVVTIGPPLLGENYIAADSCCDASRHTRAALPINGQVRIAQRFAVDWEQLNDSRQIYSGPSTDLTSYAIYGKEIIAVADARVVVAVDGLPEQVPGKFPTSLPLEQADGNAVILDLGNGNFALYAHMKTNSVRVQTGDFVRRGQVLGLVGNTGNSIAPHLHFQVMDQPSALNANGLPYQIDSFMVTGRSPGTEAFDMAERDGTALSVTPIMPPTQANNALPLDQNIILFKNSQ